jgi:hypothetical protein
MSKCYLAKTETIADAIRQIMKVNSTIRQVKAFSDWKD